MNAIRLKKHVESDTLHLPELLPFIGRDVEIIVLSEADATTQPEDALREKLRGTVIRDDVPSMSIADDDWEALD